LQLKKNWEQTPLSFRRLLAWLDEGADTGGERYLEVRRRLISYFARKQADAADELADETLNRVARRLEEEGSIPDAPARYCYIVARYVFLESLRAHRRRFEKPMDDGRRDIPAPLPDRERGMREVRLACLDRCLARLDADERDLILQYYQGEQREKIEQRRQLAARLQLTSNALAIRASRLRTHLESCVKRCSEQR
jgi:DNA-directed RNA polymerase specialized sigma24 family protein